MPNEIPVPPTVPTIPHERELHGLTAEDEYAWMRDAADPRFLAYLHAERAHYDRATGHLDNLREELFGEMERRLVPTDESVSWRRGDNFYTMRSVTGSEYEQFMSSRNAAETGERTSTVILDEATLATEEGGYVAIGLREVSPSGALLAYSVDTDGDEVYTLRFRDLRTGTDLPDTAPRSYYGGAWSSDSSTFFYAVHDQAYRPYQIWRHTIGTDCDDDVLVYTEDDTRFEITVEASTSGRFVFITAENRDTSEVWFVPADRPDAAPAVIRARRATIEYSADHADGDFVIVTNDGAEEFRLMRAPVTAPGEWIEIQPARPGERLHAAHALAGHLVLELRRDGFPLLRTIDRRTGAEREIDAGIPAGRITLYREPEYDATTITVEVESLVSPNAWFTVDLSTGARTLVKRLTVPDFAAGDYRTERRHAPATDGTLVPVTLAYRADTPLDGTAPCVMWGYGAYESCDDPEFDPGLVSLLDRGVVYALTHPRGGGENGRAWWLGGRLEAKATTFSDHVAVADWLADGLVDGTRIATRGLSAGGLLQAACARLAPARWAAVVAEVPFVDVVGSMLDETIPLTANEWDEWGDPRRPEDFAWMRAYSPYDNLPASPRPPMLVTGALHDPRVLVHEPTKYVARMRATAKPGDELLYRVETGAGAHTGPSGRYAHYRYEAEIYAWILHTLDR